jgi:Family of unknown function (DUF6516)
MVVARTIAILRNHSLVIELRIVKTLEAVGENWREYSYHWQEDGKMIRRWDNAPHHKDLVNFPHHVHDGNNILPGKDVYLTDVLNFIEDKTRFVA